MKEEKVVNRCYIPLACLFAMAQVETSCYTCIANQTLASKNIKGSETFYSVLVRVVFKKKKTSLHSDMNLYYSATECSVLIGRWVGRCVLLWHISDSRFTLMTRVSYIL